MSEPVLLVEDEGPVRTLTLNRPEKLNALSTTLVDDLSRALTATAEDDSVRVVVLAGAGRSFCAGYDLDEPAGDVDEETERGMRNNLDRLLEVFDQPQPVIARVQGHCLAGGCDLMMMCDLVVASEDAVFGQPEIRFGSAIVAHVLPWLVGARRAKELVLTGVDRLDAPSALSFGLINRMVPSERLTEETMILARQLAVVDPDVMRLTKRAMNAGWEAAGFREALRAGVEIGIQIETSKSPERVEFERITREQGLRAAVDWRDRRFRP
ncbi:MAG TPA: enoyl-CoA hydratase/isomerase family protein [Acidimicrobiia bacterium]|nr:enoyl-CoA hydratase/isomerase family protein [Acidimicrobiia bacterium]